MIDYGEPPSNQMRLDLQGYSDAGKELMDEARLWASKHYREFEFFKATARESGDKASPNYCLQVMRNKFRISVRNALSAPFARIAMEQEPSLKFRVAKSKVDGFTKAVL